MLESQIQSRIKTQLEKNGWLVIKLIQTTLNGIPDLMALKNGRTVFIEVKRPNNKPTPLQSYRHQQLLKQGFQTLVATSIKDIEHL